MNKKELLETTIKNLKEGNCLRLLTEMQTQLQYDEQTFYIGCNASELVRILENISELDEWVEELEASEPKTIHPDDIPF